ncbi:response regulator transcription factor [Parerythrobacter aurantius]|uniref:response regulator transcription factor n=1 Tax=Parerythrobacter aurantius TaxID=3127706 RepID=UPI0032538BB5
MPRTVLLVDDDPHIRQVLAFAFAKAGMQVVEAADGVEALARAAESGPDLVVLDINMPSMDGLEVCRRLRADSDVPILFLSSRDDEIDRVLGIELGADDYVVKPFSPREVVARSNAILRRTVPRGIDERPGPDQSAHGLLRLDSDGWEARWADQPVALTVTEFGLLKALASAPGRIFTRDQLIDRLRGPGFAVTDRTIDSHIRNLRRKFAEIGANDLIETRTGIGYRLGPCTGGVAA